MNLRLRLLQGTLQKRGGRRADEITIRKTRYYIGSEPDCHLRCPTSGLDARHCVLIRSDTEVAVHDLNTASGTFVNDRKVMGRQVLANGDLLRVGRLEFEVVLAAAVDASHEMFNGRWRGSPATPAAAGPPKNAVERLDGDITDMLERADEHERQERLSNPETMRFDTTQVGNLTTPEAEPEEEAETKDSVLPKRQPPQKLPERPKPEPLVSGNDPTTAAQDMLKKMFGQQ